MRLAAVTFSPSRRRIVQRPSRRSSAVTSAFEPQHGAGGARALEEAGMDRRHVHVLGFGSKIAPPAAPPA